MRSAKKLTDAINVGTNVILTYTKNNGVQVNADRTRVFPVYDATGNYFRTSPTDFGHPLANANEVAALANSDGCKVKLPIAYQHLCPAIVFPNKNKPAKDKSETPKIIVAYFS